MNGNNWYVYAGDNPVNLVDQNGKDPVTDSEAGLGVSLFGGSLFAAFWLMAELLEGTKLVPKVFTYIIKTLGAWSAMVEAGKKSMELAAMADEGGTKSGYYAAGYGALAVLANVVMVLEATQALCCALGTDDSMDILD
jgi:hypothetical protein